MAVCSLPSPSMATARPSASLVISLQPVGFSTSVGLSGFSAAASPQNHLAISFPDKVFLPLDHLHLPFLHSQLRSSWSFLPLTALPSAQVTVAVWSLPSPSVATSRPSASLVISLQPTGFSASVGLSGFSASASASPQNHL